MDQADELRRLIKNLKQQQISNQKTINSKNNNSKVITVVSGKGGVGKSNFSLNLSLYLASTGKKVIIIDADFGCANIEVLFGIRPDYNLQHIINGSKNISEIIMQTKFGISFISGGSGFKSLSDLSQKELDYFVEQFEYLDNLFDIIIIDTGSGVSRTVTTFAKASDKVIIITTPEPTSFTDAYAFMKVISQNQNFTPPIYLVINKSESYFEAINVYNKLFNASTKFLNLPIKYLGYIPLDDFLIKSVKKQKPIILAYPNSQFSKHIVTIGQKINIDSSQNNVSGAKSFIQKLINIFNK